MLHSITGNQELIAEDIYDQHAAPLYGIIMKITQNKNEAEEILTRSFKSFFMQPGLQVIDSRIFLSLLKISLRIAAERVDLPIQKIGKIMMDSMDHKITTSNALFVNKSAALEIDFL